MQVQLVMEKEKEIEHLKSEISNKHSEMVSLKTEIEEEKLKSQAIVETFEQKLQQLHQVIAVLPASYPLEIPKRYSRRARTTRA